MHTHKDRRPKVLYDHIDPVHKNSFEVGQIFSRIWGVKTAISLFFGILGWKLRKNGKGKRLFNVHMDPIM